MTECVNSRSPFAIGNLYVVYKMIKTGPQMIKFFNSGASPVDRWPSADFKLDHKLKPG